MILIDMHVHSCYSDGTFTPEQLVSAARRRGLSLLSLTDHDTTAGLGPLMRACAKEGIKGHQARGRGDAAVLSLSLCASYYGRALAPDGQ